MIRDGFGNRVEVELPDFTIYGVQRINVREECWHGKHGFATDNGLLHYHARWDMQDGSQEKWWQALMDVERTAYAA